jgi:hypothetical protein
MRPSTQLGVYSIQNIIIILPFKPTLDATFDEPFGNNHIKSMTSNKGQVDLESDEMFPVCLHGWQMASNYQSADWLVIIDAGRLWHPSSKHCCFIQQ